MFINWSYLVYAILILIVGLLLFGINKYLSLKNSPGGVPLKGTPSGMNSYNNKMSLFECGLSSFVQTRSSYHVSFILIAILFLLFDLEISSLLLYSLVLLLTNAYGLTIVILFVLILIFGFIYEFNTDALHIKKNNIKRLSKNNLYNWTMLNDLTKLYFYLKNK